MHISAGADPEILKVCVVGGGGERGGHTKLSDPELPYSGFVSFLNLL